MRLGLRPWRSFKKKSFLENFLIGWARRYTAYSIPLWKAVNVEQPFSSLSPCCTEGEGRGRKEDEWKQRTIVRVVEGRGRQEITRDNEWESGKGNEYGEWCRKRQRKKD